MDERHKIVWSEGMLLTPHHFQHADRYYDGLLTDRMQTLAPYGWGICEIDIDRDGLANGNFTLLGLRAVMPDGIAAHMPHQDPLPPTRTIGALFPESLDYMDVFLGIAMEHVGAENCHMENGAASRHPRYTGHYVSLPDHNTGQNLRDVMVARKNFRILFSGEEMPDASIMKIAELERTPAGAIALRESYMPPLLWMNGSPALVRMVRSILELLVSMGTALADQQRGIREHGGMDLLRFSLLHAIYSYIPLFAHFSRAGRVHPERVYLAFAQLVGQLAVTATDVHPKDVPPYDHTNLSDCFRALELMIRDVVEHITPTRYLTIPLEQRGEYLRVGQIADRSLLDRGQFILAATGDGSADDLRSMLLKRVKVGAADDMDLILNAAMPGVKFHHMARPPASIPSKTGHQYFALESHGKFWERVKQSQVLAVYVPGDLHQFALELLVTKE